MEAIAQHATYIVGDMYGNYVLQYIFPKVGFMETKAAICEK